MLDLQGCQFRQGDFTLSADWSLEEGARLAVIGPSGAGKSTLLSGIAGFADTVGGRLQWGGTDIPERADQRPVAMLFQDHNLFPHLTAAQNVGLGLAPRLRLGGGDAQKVSDALTHVGLGGLGARRPSELSGGQQSRVALARILVMARPIILLDEPFSALGPAQRQEMLDLVKTLAEDLGACLIMVTHNPAEAKALDGNVSFVERGTAHAPVPTKAFFESPPEGMRIYGGL